MDIDLFTTPEDFNLKILDEGGHPNKEGYILLDAMIKFGMLHHWINKMSNFNSGLV